MMLEPPLLAYIRLAELHCWPLNIIKVSNIISNILRLFFVGTLFPGTRNSKISIGVQVRNAYFEILLLLLIMVTHLNHQRLT